MKTALAYYEFVELWPSTKVGGPCTLKSRGQVYLELNISDASVQVRFRFLGSMCLCW